jgi:uncharacterized protein YkwD
MMSRTQRANNILAAFLAALALASCGGGGGGGNSSNEPVGVTGPAPTPVPTPAPTPTPTNPPATVPDPAAPIQTNDIAADGRAWMNYRRAQIGMSVLSRNPTIDVAAQGHSDYQRINNLNPTHTQEAGKPGFTGTDVAARMRAAGYVFNGSNLVGEVIAASTSGTGFGMAEELITAIYHRFVIFEPMFKEIGAGGAVTPGGYAYLTANLAANNGLGTGLPANTLAMWPFSGQTGVQRNFFSNTEEPDPVPDANEVGYPISVHANINMPIVVQTFTVRAHGAGSDLPVYTVNNESTSSVPGQGHPLTAAAIIPRLPLAAATTYDVSFSGTLNGTPVSKSWSFTTK